MNILIIDYNNDITDVVKFYCDSKNILCQTAGSALEGLALIRNNAFDLVLLDLAMPEVSGLDVVKLLKDENLLKKLNVVIFTASSDPKMFEEIRKMGVNKILKKPCSLEDLDELFKKPVSEDTEC